MEDEDDKRHNKLIEQMNEILTDIEILNYNLRRKHKILKHKQENKSSEEIISDDEDVDKDVSSLISSPPKPIKKDKTSLREDLKLDDDSLKNPVGIKELVNREKKQIEDLLTKFSEFKKELNNFKRELNISSDNEKEPPEKKQKTTKDGKKKRSRSKRQRKSKSKYRRRKYSRRS
jgi:hypothetical protein